MTHRRAAAGARRDEADLDRAARPGHRRRRHRRAGPRDQPAQRRLRGARRPASSPRRWSRWCWPTRCWRSSAATRSTETARNARRLPRATCRSPDAAGRRARRPAGVGQVDRRAGRRRRAARRAEPGHRRRRRGRAPGSRIARPLRRARRGRTSGSSSGPRSPPRWPSTTACSRSAAARCSTTATRELLRGRTVVFLDVGIKDAASRIGLNRDRPLLLGNPRAQWIRLMEAPAAALRGGRDASTVLTDGRTPDEVADRGRAPRPGCDAAPTRITVGGAPPYDVVVGRRARTSCPPWSAAPPGRCWWCTRAALADLAGRRRAQPAARPGVDVRARRRCRTARRPRRVDVAAGLWSLLGRRAFTRSRRRRRRSAAARRPTWPASSPPPGCAACRSCTCRRRCSAWSTPRSAARPGSTPPRARTWSAPSTRRPACCATSTTLATLPRAELVSGLAEVVKTGLRRRPADPRAGRGRPDGGARPGRTACCASWSSARCG